MGQNYYGVQLLLKPKTSGSKDVSMRAVKNALLQSNLVLSGCFFFCSFSQIRQKRARTIEIPDFDEAVMRFWLLNHVVSHLRKKGGKLWVLLHLRAFARAFSPSLTIGMTGLGWFTHPCSCTSKMYVSYNNITTKRVTNHCCHKHVNEQTEKPRDIYNTISILTIR